MPWQVYLVESDTEFVTYQLPSSRTLIGHRDRIHEIYGYGLKSVQVAGVDLKISVLSGRIIVFIDLNQKGGRNVLISNFREPDSFRSLAALRELQIESTDCLATLSASGAPGIAIQINDRPGHYYALKWWNTDVGPYPTPLESPASPPSP